jgi:hypothetical protein
MENVIICSRNTGIFVKVLIKRTGNPPKLTVVTAIFLKHRED